MANKLTDQEITQKRMEICDKAKQLLGIPYKYGFEWKDFNKTPEYMDCSEMFEGIFSLCGLKLPDGSYNQYDYCKPIDIPQPADLGFLQQEDSEQICHVFMLFDNYNVIEARGKPNWKVCFTPRVYWENSDRFRGWRSHPFLYSDESN